MNKKIYVLSLISLFALGAGCASTGETVATEPANIAVAQAEGVTEFTVNAANFSFAPNTMTVKKGDTVRITFQNIEGFHDLKIDEFGVATRKLQAKESDTVEFVTDQAGAFEYYCSIGSHRAMGMWGTLVVEE